MPLEPSFDNIDDLDPLNPFGTDPKSEGDDHLRGIKSSLIANCTGSALETRLLVAAVAEVIASNALLRLVRPDPGAYTLQGEDSAGINGTIEFDPVTGVSIASPISASRILPALDVVTLTDILTQLRILNPTAANGLALELEQTTGKGSIRETDGAGTPGNAWQTFVAGAGVGLNFADIQRLITTALGATIEGSLLDLDNSTQDEDTFHQLRNLIGGWRLRARSGDGAFELVQTLNTGVEQIVSVEVDRFGVVLLKSNGLDALRTVATRTDNSGAEVFDGSGIARPVGFNLLPRLDFVASTTVTGAQSGAQLRCNASLNLTFPNTLPTDFTCVVLNTTAGVVGLIGSGGATVRLFTGDAVPIDGTITMAAGSVATVSKAGTAAVFEVWGNGATQ